MPFYPMYQIDAFTDKLFHGNPAAVIPLENWLSDELMLNIAKENNLSETAFFIPMNNQFHIRWFTPAAEVELCGHATLATAHYIYTETPYKESSILFKSSIGTLIVAKKDEGYIMDFPTDSIRPYDDSNSIKQVIGMSPRKVFQGKDDILAILNTEHDVLNCRPDFNKLIELGVRGMIVSAQGTETDIISRCFYPAYGVDEDPVTGSAHTLLSAYWSKTLNKDKFTAYQASERGGYIICSVSEDRTFLEGKAVTYSKGQIFA